MQRVPDARESTWNNTSDDPHFVVPVSLPRGWLRVRLRMACEAEGYVTLYVDTGAGFSALGRTDLAYNLGRVDVDRRVYLPEPVRALRLDMPRDARRFQIEHLSIHTVPAPTVWAASLGGAFKHFAAPGRLGRALRTATALAARGQFGDIRKKLQGGFAFAPWDFPALSDAQRETLRAEAAQLTNAPLISVLMPVYNTPEAYLRAAIESVRRQLYERWELCVADDCSSKPHVRTVLDEFAARDKRIRIAYRERNGDIAAASNSALELATGEYAALLDHDDELAEHALLRAAQTIAADRSVDVLYTDEDKLDHAGRHVDPFCKPAWSPEYLLSCMYPCHLGVYRTALVREAGGFRSECDGAQDYDLALRLTARTQTVRHIPEVLYHWRLTPQSTSSGHAAKPKAHAAAQRALMDHLKQLNRAGTVEDGPAPGFHRVRFAVAGQPKVRVIIAPGPRRAQCVESIRAKSTYGNYEIVTPGPSAHADGVNMARTLNAAAENAGGEYLLFLHDDVEVVTPQWIENLLACAQTEGVGAVGSKLFFPDGRLQHAGISVLGAEPRHVDYGAPGDTPGRVYCHMVQRNVSAVTGACLLTAAATFRAAGGFTEALPSRYWDVDYCLKLLASGKRVVYTPCAELYHHEAPPVLGADAAELAEFRRRWKEQCRRDPYWPIGSV